MSNRKRTILLEHEAILQKINRMAWQVYETNSEVERLILVGIAKKGKIINDLLAERLRAITDIDIIEMEIVIDKKVPNNSNASLSQGISLKDECVVIVDDVLNSGKTMIYAALPILAQGPHKLQTCVLANRDHKRFPINADFVGISLSTTLQEHISFELDKGAMTVYLS